eukprot:661281-Prymnesium_polylepis.2
MADARSRCSGGARIRCAHARTPCFHFNDVDSVGAPFPELRNRQKMTPAKMIVPHTPAAIPM